MQPVSTRENLVHLLRFYGPLTVADLGKFLGVSTTAVRQHLDHLQAEGSIEVTGLRRGRGRPKRLFALTPMADRFFPQHYDTLVLNLLDAISRLPEGPSLIQRILESRRELWHERHAPRFAGKSLEEKLALLIELFNEKGSLADCTAQPDGTYLLTKRHCIIGAVVDRYPVFCQDNRALLREVLQVEVEELQSRAAGDPMCVFQIMPRPEHLQDGPAGLPGKGE